MVALDRVKKVYSFWGRFPFLYALQDYVTFLGRPGLIRRKAVERLCVKRGDRVLEVACGTGRNFPYILEVVGAEGRLTGFDYSEEMLSASRRWCKKNGRENIALVHGNAAELRIDGTDFDGVLSVLGISAIPEWKQAILRCYEVLRPGGRLVVCDARLFQGVLAFLNPLIKAVYSRFAAWDPAKSIPETMNEIFGNVQIEGFNLGTFYIATCIKK